MWPFRRREDEVGDQPGDGHVPVGAALGSPFGFAAQPVGVDLRAVAGAERDAAPYPGAVLQFDPSHWKRGWVDGCLGQLLPTGESIIRARLQQEAEAKAETLRSRLSAVRVELGAWRDRLGYLDRVCRSLQERYEGVAERRDLRRQDFSLPLGLLMLMAAAILFLSDIPLTLQLVADGFDLPTSVPHPEFERDVHVYEIFSEPLVVVRLLWESLALALGLAGAGMFYKIFLDRWVMGEPRRSRRLAVVLCGVALLFVGTTIMVGMFRSERQAAILANSPAATPTGVAVGTFIALTLLLPLVGGICFFDGWERVTNWWQYAGARFARWRAERATKAGLRRVGRLGRQAAVLDASLTSLVDQFARMVEAALGVYRHGYLRGAMTPDLVDTSTGWYERCSRILARRIGGEERRRISRLVSQEGVDGLDEAGA